VIGREFSHKLISAVADRPQEQLESWLDQLVASELLDPRCRGGDKARRLRTARSGPLPAQRLAQQAPDDLGLLET
jgi:hypothetical protein